MDMGSENQCLDFFISHSKRGLYFILGLLETVTFEPYQGHNGRSNNLLTGDLWSLMMTCSSDTSFVALKY